jgi:DNA repair protein RecN (Recombination protein N)
VLIELRVRHLGVIDDQALVLGPGMTALTGETGAGKTLIVDAIELLLGGRTDPVLVRPGAGEATVEGRFSTGGDENRSDRTEGDGTEGVGREVVLGRVVPGQGRSRAYVDGRMASSAVLGEVSADLVDLHGQHAHQSLLSPAVQRASLDAFAGVDHTDERAARARLAAVRRAQRELGGDERARAREADLLRFQLDELDSAGIDDPDEDDALRAEEERLADATAHREALEAVHDAVTGEAGASDRLGAALGLLAGRRALADVHARLHGLVAELSDVATDARGRADDFEEDPERLVEVGARRHLLQYLRRKYGDTLAEVVAYRDDARRRLDEIGSHAARAARLEQEETAAAAELAAAVAAVGECRRAAAGRFAAAVESGLHDLALPRARFLVEVGDDPGGDAVTWRFSANPGEAPLPLAKVASGGELARTMLAARLVLSGASSTARGAGAGGRTSRTLVFDEVDAGIGGEAAVAVGRALATLARDHQVLVVTHLPQVAAFADHQVVVTKRVEDGRTHAEVGEVDGEARVVELSRMLSGHPDSATGRRHAAELLELAAAATAAAATAGAGRAGTGPVRKSRPAAR